MAEQKNLGTWTATIKNDGKAPAIDVNGIDIPTTGIKPKFELLRKDPQGVTDTELVLYINFGDAIVAGGRGRINLHYNEIIEREPFKTVLIVDIDGKKDRVIANINVN